MGAWQQHASPQGNDSTRAVQVTLTLTLTLHGVLPWRTALSASGAACAHLLKGIDSRLCPERNQRV